MIITGEYNIEKVPLKEFLYLMHKRFSRLIGPNDLLLYDMTKLSLDQTSFQMLRQTGCQYVYVCTHRLPARM